MNVAHDGVPLDIHDTVECAGTTIGRSTVNIWYLIVRLLFAIGITSIMIWSLVRFAKAGFFFVWFVYITHWGLIVNSTYMWSSVILHFKIYKAVNFENKTENNNNFIDYKSIDLLHLRWLWVWTLYFLDIGVSLAIFIIFLYWGLVYEGGSVLAISWNTHGTAGALIIIEWLTNTWQLTYRGAYFLFLTALAWTIVSIIFYFSGATTETGNRYIYSVLDWGVAPGTATLYACVVCTSMPIFHCLMVALKNCIMKCWVNSRTKDEKAVLIFLGDDVDKNGQTKTTEMAQI